MPVGRTSLQGSGRPEGLDVRVGSAAVLRITPDERRVRVGLVMGGTDRAVDISAQPSAAVACIDDAARRAGVPVEQARAEVEGCMASFTEMASPPESTSEERLLAVLGAGAYPMLAEAYRQGVAPLHEVPRWATRAFARPTARQAAVDAFGGCITRPVVAAFARAIAPPAVGTGPRHVGVGALGLSMMVAPTLDPDRLARLVVDLTDARPAGAPTPDAIEAGRAMADRVGPLVAPRVVLDSAIDADGPRVLADLLRIWGDVESRLPARLPRRLGALHDLCRGLLRTDPGPLPVSERPPPPGRPLAELLPCPQRHVRPQPTVRREPTPVLASFEQPRIAPASANVGPVTDTTPILITPALLACDGLEVGRLRLVAPRTCGDLRRWGRALRTCVGDYGPAAAAGRSQILGVFADAAVVGCLELDADGHLRQMLGPANRPLRPDRRDAIVGRLTELGVLNRDGGSRR